MEKNEEGLKVIRLKGENIKSIRAIDITPDRDDTSIIVSGSNGAGKSTVLNMIWLAMSNDAIKKDVVSTDKSKGNIELDLGEYIVTRTYDKLKGTKLKVMSKDGTTYNSPQTLLNDLYSKHAISPLQFIRMKEKEQREFLLNLLNLKFDTASLDCTDKIKTLDDINEYRRKVYDKRTVANRTIKSLTEQLAPMKDIDEATTVQITEIITKRDTTQQIFNKGKEIFSQIGTLTEEIESLEKQLTDKKQTLEKLSYDVMNYDFVELEQSIVSLDTELEEADRINEIARKFEQKRILTEQLEEAIKTSDQHTETLALIDDIKTKTLENCVMPLQGLTVDDTCVRLNNVAVQDLSMSEQWKLSCAIMMAENPKLKVITVEDGSLLDDESMKVLIDMAKEKGYQIWIEVVSKDPVGIHIVDGEVGGSECN